MKFEQLMQAMLEARAKKHFPMSNRIYINPKDFMDLRVELDPLRTFPDNLVEIDKAIILGVEFRADHKVQEGTIELVEIVRVLEVAKKT